MIKRYDIRPRRKRATDTRLENDAAEPVEQAVSVPE
jgi:hypothetical protein